MGKRKRSFKNFMLDPRFQLKYAVAISLTGGLIFAVMGWFFFDKVRENSQLAAIDLAAAAAPAPSTPVVQLDVQPVKIETERLKMPGDPVAAPGAVPAPVPPAQPDDAAFQRELQSQLERSDAPILWWLAGSLLLLMFLLFLIGVLATHRIVGPIYVVDMYLQKIMAGEPVRQRALRKGDEFQALFDHVNQMAAALTDERRSDVERVDRAVTMLTARVDSLDGPVTREQLRAWLEDCLAPAREMVAEKRRYVTDSTAPGPIPPPM
jgi:hypothetical protein